ncbi:response regulator [Cohnella sp. GCM10027633]|uniref:response regulator transcription factor n=1 Tax=unclassified Cohnella TaxID=2636738 RepID=UPI00364581BD
MLRLMIVDDELFAVKALMKAIDFAALGIEEVYQASGATVAKDILGKHPIDLIVCDIEMPDVSGLALTEWVNEHYPDTETIFLTAHAEFSYAQKAVELASFEYLLKPVKPDQLVATLKRAAAKVQGERDSARIVEENKKYQSMWESQKTVVIERYWQNVLAGRVAVTGDGLKAINLPLQTSSALLPIQISIEQWQQDFGSRDEEIMEYALRNAATELIIGAHEGNIIKDTSGILLVLIYGKPGVALRPEELVAACRTFAEACERYFYCKVSCYIGNETTIYELTETCHRLLELEQANVYASLSVQLLGESTAPAQARKKPPIAIPWPDWVVLFETGNKKELLKRLDGLLEAFPEERVDRETASALYHALSHMIYYVAHRNGISVMGWQGLKERHVEAASIRTIAQFKSWAEWLIDTSSRYLDAQRNESSVIIERAKQYIMTSLREVTRESVAGHIHLNSAYLSRLFKRETGQSIIDYIINAKMERAKSRLTATNTKLLDICEEIGYENYSHFGQAFKAKVGVSPQEYRKRYQQVDIG